MSEGQSTVFPANTQILVRIWDANGLPLYTSDIFDWSGEPCDLALRTMYIDAAHVQVSGSFYAGFQIAPGSPGGEFGYKVDYPLGNQYRHSFQYKISTGVWSALTNDLMFDVTVDIANGAPTANAGPNAKVMIPNALTLAGSISDDGLPNPPAACTAAWSKVSGPGTVTFGDSASASTTVTFSTAGTYVLQLTANDSALTGTSNVMVTALAPGDFNGAARSMVWTS
jgi:hypothetical protein